MAKYKMLMEDGLAALCTHLKATKAQVTGTGTAVTALAEAVDQSLQEIEAALNDLPSAVPITLPTSGWLKDQTAAYPYYYDIVVADITVLDRAEITIAPGSLGTVKACGLCPTNETLGGKIRVRSTTIPTTAISAEYWIAPGKEQ